MYCRVIAACAAASLGVSGVSAQTRPAPAAPRPAAPASAVPIPRATFLADMDIEFKIMDADKNGLVTRQEVEKLQRAVAALQAQARLRARFAQLDTDRNGQLSLTEFERLQAAPPAPNAAPMLSRFDLNGDGSVSLIEFRTGTLANFDRLDADKDGIVSPAEMKAGGIGK